MHLLKLSVQFKNQAHARVYLVPRRFKYKRDIYHLGYMKCSGRQATREGSGLLGRVRPGERLALSWRTNTEFNTKSYHIFIYSVRQTLLFGEELNLTSLASNNEFVDA
jgi:hypothetical protein